MVWRAVRRGGHGAVAAVAMKPQLVVEQARAVAGKLGCDQADRRAELTRDQRIADVGQVGAAGAVARLRFMDWP